MNAKKIISKVNAQYKQDNGCPMQDNGKRLRVTKECAARGPEYFEAGSTFFYAVQAKPEAAANLIPHYVEGVKVVPVGETFYDYRPWPKESWGNQIFKIVAVEA